MLTLQYASPESEDDMDENKGDEDDDEEDEEVEEDEKDVRPAPPSGVPQMVPRQVGMTESRPCTIMSALSSLWLLWSVCWLLSCISPEVSSWSDTSIFEKAAATHACQVSAYACSGRSAPAEALGRSAPRL